MAKLPSLTAREVLKALQQAGFYVFHQSGSHAQLRHPAKNQLRITIPVHNNDLPKFVIHSILRQAELSVDEFMELL